MDKVNENGATELISMVKRINCPYQLHEIPKLVNFLGKTQGRYHEALKWNSYYNNYLYYLDLLKNYKPNCGLKVPYEPTPPSFNLSVDNETHDSSYNKYKRPTSFQNSGKTFNPSKVVYRGSDCEYKKLKNKYDYDPDYTYDYDYNYTGDFGTYQNVDFIDTDEYGMELVEVAEN